MAKTIIQLADEIQKKAKKLKIWGFDMNTSKKMSLKKDLLTINKCLDIIDNRKEEEHIIVK